MEQDFDFDTWFDLFFTKCRALGYMGPVDKHSFESDYEEGQEPEEAAESFVSEITEE